MVVVRLAGGLWLHSPVPIGAPLARELAEPSLVTPLLFRGLGVFRRPGATRYYRKRTRDPAAMAAALDRVLAWDIGQVVTAHGDVLPTAHPGQLRVVLGRRSPLRTARSLLIHCAR